MAAEVGDDGRQVAGALDGRAGGDADVDADLGGDDVGERGLSQAGRAIEQDVVDGFIPSLGGGDGDFEVVLGLVLSDKIGQAPRPQAGIKRCILGTGLTRYDASYIRLPP